MNIQELILSFNNHSRLYRRDSTIRTYSYILKRFFLETEAQPEKVNKKFILNYCMSKTKGDVYVRVIALKRALKQFFIFLNEELDYKIDLTMFDNFKIKEKDYKPLPVMRFNDAVNIVKSVKKRMHTFAQRRDALLLLLYSTTGMRKTEVVNIKMNDVDFKNGFINIWQTKTNQPRSIPVPNFLIRELLEYLKERERLAKCDNLIITFCGKPVTESCLTSIPKTFKQLYGITFSFHSFRRGYASDLFSSGVKITNISKCLGHAKISTTLNYYIYTTDRELREEVSKHPAYLIDSIESVV